MTRTLWLLPLAMILAGCESYDDGYGPEPYPPASPYPPEPLPPAPYPGGPASYRAIGTEPFWDLELGAEMVFTDRGTGASVRQPTPIPINGVAGEIYRTPRIEANIVHSRCSDGMSDRSYPHTVQLLVDGRSYKGCGAPTAWFASTDERGMPVPPMTGPDLAPPLERTRWRVVAVNGRPTPPSEEFGIDFDEGRMTARLGCNRLGGSYRQSGATLSVSGLVATRMACPDMSFETAGSTILRQAMTVQALDPARLSLANAAGTIDLERR